MLTSEEEIGLFRGEDSRPREWTGAASEADMPVLPGMFADLLGKPEIAHCILECYLADSDPDLVRLWPEPVLKDP
ncbi:MAG: hypothetical protein P8Z78_01160 [Gammaproteobacteria bacterium]